VSACPAAYLSAILEYRVTAALPVRSLCGPDPTVSPRLARKNHTRRATAYKPPQAAREVGFGSGIPVRVAPRAAKTCSAGRPGTAATTAPSSPRTATSVRACTNEPSLARVACNAESVEQLLAGNLLPATRDSAHGRAEGLCGLWPSVAYDERRPRQGWLPMQEESCAVRSGYACVWRRSSSSMVVVRVFHWRGNVLRARRIQEV